MPPGEKLDIVLRVISGEVSVSQAARQAKVSEQSVGNWKCRFIAAGRQGLDGAERRNAERERQLLAEIAELKAALGEIYVQLRSKRQSVDYRTVPSQALRRYGSTPGSASQGSAEFSRYPGGNTRGGR
ncbi:transposase [Kitasatospora sp. NPDC101155]|uniref:transposase n=1 Tax=Kitasatospora sp. NPDC101155 TaxID=3364097 RepID=UPI0038102D93